MEIKVNARKKQQPEIGLLFEGKNVRCRNRPLRLGKSNCGSSSIYRGTWKGIAPSAEFKAAVKRVKKQTVWNTGKSLLTGIKIDPLITRMFLKCSDSRKILNGGY